MSRQHKPCERSRITHSDHRRFFVNRWNSIKRRTIFGSREFKNLESRSFSWTEKSYVPSLAYGWGKHKARRNNNRPGEWQQQRPSGYLLCCHVSLLSQSDEFSWILEIRFFRLLSELRHSGSINALLFRNLPTTAHAGPLGSNAASYLIISQPPCCECHHAATIISTRPRVLCFAH